MSENRNRRVTDRHSLRRACFVIVSRYLYRFWNWLAYSALPRFYFLLRLMLANFFTKYCNESLLMIDLPRVAKLLSAGQHKLNVFLSCEIKIKVVSSRFWMVRKFPGLGKFPVSRNSKKGTDQLAENLGNSERKAKWIGNFLVTNLISRMVVPVFR